MNEMRKKPWFPLSDETFKAFTLNWLAGQSVRRTWPSSFFFKVWRWIIRKWDLIDGKSIRGCIHHIGRKSSKEGDVDSLLNSVLVFFNFLPFYKRNNSDPMRNWKKKKSLSHENQDILPNVPLSGLWFTGSLYLTGQLAHLTKITQ